MAFYDRSSEDTLVRVRVVRPTRCKSWGQQYPSAGRRGGKPAAVCYNRPRSFTKVAGLEPNFKGRLEVCQVDKVGRASQAEGSAQTKAQGRESGLHDVK